MRGEGCNDRDRHMFGPTDWACANSATLYTILGASHPSHVKRGDNPVYALIKDSVNKMKNRCDNKSIILVQASTMIPCFWLTNLSSRFLLKLASHCHLTAFFFSSKFALKQLVPHPKRVLELTSGFLKISSGYGVIRHSKGSTTPNKGLHASGARFRSRRFRSGSKESRRP